jgi:tRNA A-37 threonylcarbamoyl transferase component Bud32
MGTVWHGTDELLRREVAVKQIRIPDTLGDEERTAIEGRVMREARAAAQLNHHGAVSVFDVAQEDGQAFIVMELVTAPSLADLVEREGPLSPERAAEIGLEVLDALQAAHAKGIVHRDVKPANVMVPEDGHVKLADFGIASLVDDPRLTSTGLILGSPAYMAPEQAQEQESEPATDLWGLGATLFYAVGGVPPFDKGNPIATLTSVLHDQIEMPAGAGELGPVIVELLRKDPSARPSPGYLQAMLRRVAEGRPVADRTTSTQELHVPAAVLAPEESIQTEAVAERISEPPEPIAYQEVEYDDEGPSRRAPWIVAVAAVAAAALLLFIVLNQSNDPGGRRARNNAGATNTTAASSDGTTDSGAGGAPAGWTSYTDDQTGYQISYPEGWDVFTNGTLTDFRDPGTGTYLRVDWVTPPGESPEGAWQAQSDSFGAAHDNYQELRIDPTTYQGFDAAEWEYTYTDGGADLHAIDLGFIAGDYGFALNFQTHAEDWDSSQPLFEQFKEAFKAPQ